MKQIAKIREKLFFDVAVVGAGVAGLSAAIRLKQLDPKLEICVLEKALSIGDHVTSGCLFNPRALNELLPHWETMNSPISTRAAPMKNIYLTENRAISIPKLFTPWGNLQGLYITSLSQVCRWLKTIAEDLNVHIYEGFCAKELLFSPLGYLEGIATGVVGLEKNNEKNKFFQDSLEIHASQTILAEGAGGFFSGMLSEKFRLKGLKNADYESYDQTFSLGLKEVWNVENGEKGMVLNTFNWPVSETRNRGFLLNDGKFLHVGLSVGLDYKNPYIDIYKEFQRFKRHDFIKKFLEGGSCVEFSGKVVEDGGFFSVPKLSFPGGMLVGAAGGVNNPISMQGAHNSMKSAMIAAETIHWKMQYSKLSGVDLKEYFDNYRKSWVFEELYQYRHVRQAFNKSAMFGLAYAAYYGKIHQDKSMFAMETSIKGENASEREMTNFSVNYKKIVYPENDKIFTFDKEESLEKTKNIFRNQSEYISLRKNAEKDASYSRTVYVGLEEKLCPTGVFEYSDKGLSIDSRKCIQCGACRLKSVRNIIEWTLPEAGTGPQ